MERSNIVEVDFVEWALLQQKIGRIAAVRDYIRHHKEAGLCLPFDCADILAALLGEKTNEAEKKINQSEKRSETE